VSTVTPRLGLTKPVGSEQYSVTIINNNNDLIDTFASGTVDKLSPGAVGYLSNAALNTISNTTVRYDLVAVNLKANHYYRIKYRTDDVCSAAANMPYTMTCVKSVTTDTTTAGTAIDNGCILWTAPVANSGKTNFAEFYFKASATETVNIKINGIRSGANDLIISNRVLTVVDEGMQF
jgi:hypothetical protein